MVTAVTLRLDIETVCGPAVTLRLDIETVCGHCCDIETGH